MVIHPGSKGRNSESLIKMLNNGGRYRRKGEHKTVGGKRKNSAICAWISESKGSLIKSVTWTRGGLETRQ